MLFVLQHFYSFRLWFIKQCCLNRWVKLCSWCFSVPQVKSLTNAHGRAASGDSPGATSWRDTTANTPVPSLLSATTVTGLSKHNSPSFPAIWFWYYSIYLFFAMLFKAVCRAFVIFAVWCRKSHKDAGSCFAGMVTNVGYFGSCTVEHWEFSL